MRAALLTEYGDVDMLEIRDVSEPEPGAWGKVRVAASSINPLDYGMRSARLRSQRVGWRMCDR
jgi:NADPH:quinone reductase-like Zn-dependent oxidoreductase